jgi:hypothetical protein
LKWVELAEGVEEEKAADLRMDADILVRSF